VFNGLSASAESSLSYCKCCQCCQCCQPASSAFRDHWKQRKCYSHNKTRGVCACAQRLTASSESSLAHAWLEPRPVKPVVLNAFRHHWNPFGANHVFGDCWNVCSTPFGITGILASLSAPKAPLAACAQRLSASLESSLANRRRALSRCSAQRLSASLETFTFVSRSQLDSLAMLNNLAAS
jgi:hypothetical protein